MSARNVARVTTTVAFAAVVAGASLIISAIRHIPALARQDEAFPRHEGSLQTRAPVGNGSLVEPGSSPEPAAPAYDEYEADDPDPSTPLGRRWNRWWDALSQRRGLLTSMLAAGIGGLVVFAAVGLIVQNVPAWIFWCVVPALFVDIVVFLVADGIRNRKREPDPWTADPSGWRKWRLRVARSPRTMTLVKVFAPLAAASWFVSLFIPLVSVWACVHIAIPLFTALASVVCSLLLLTCEPKQDEQADKEARNQSADGKLA
jgi:hypothetical protein